MDDGKLGKDEGTVHIAVSPVNDAPTAILQTVTLHQGTSRLIVLHGSDLETSAADLASVIVEAPVHGTLAQEAVNAWRYTPDSGYVGNDSFTFTSTDRGDPDGSLRMP